MTEEMIENSLVSTMNPLLLLISLVAFCFTAFLSARHFRNTSDFKKSVKLYIPLAVVEVVLSVIIGVPFIMAIGGGLAGFVVLMLVSNHYFYK